ncbi:uncharacterized protein LOC124539607 [Vanessa cardui]|uniref:uncharacterized protein LOC124539607 n=1 Tax=Vanessa cardui TaxID=171605 RepID=UPI001F13D17E|nr:uncharacterized protein LOC124539607 [Vanessa cardui]
MRAIKIALDWFSSYLRGRQQAVRLDQSLSGWLDLSAGVPQGIVQRGKGLINESALKSPPRGGKEASSQLPWSNKLRAGINQYINKYGYQDAKTHIEKLVEETETAENVLLNVKVAHNGTIDIDFVPVLRSSKHKKENKRGLEFEPQWLVEFKEFIKALIQSYGRENVEKMMEPFIKTIEIKNLVKIKDIDGEYYFKILSWYIEGFL